MAQENDELTLSFVEEANETLADIENDLLAIEEGGSNIDSDLVNKVFRGIHSMKGSAGFLGLKSIGTLAHESENVLNLIRNNELVPSSPVVSALLKAADALRNMVNNVQDSNQTDVSEYCRGLKTAVEGGASEETQESLNRDVDISLPDGRMAFVIIKEMELVMRQKQGGHIYVAEVDFFEDVQAKSITPLDFLKKVYDHAELIDSYMSTSGVGSLSATLPDSLAFMMLIGSKLSHEELADTLGIALDRVYHIATPEQIYWEESGPTATRHKEPAPVETIASTTPSTPKTQQKPSVETAPKALPVEQTMPPATQAAAADAHSSSQQTSLRVNVKVLDTLMNLAGELVLGRNQLLQEAQNKENQGIESVAARIDQVTSELQEAIMQTRMQPVGTVFNKFPRIIRDLSSKLGKQCELTVEGKDVELDKTIIEGIGDPLTHLIRNSIDHGIEEPEERRQCGKNPCGTVVLRAFHQAGKVNISITDDGAGINAAKLKEKALAKGVLTPEQAKQMTERDVLRLIFHPGFSMAKKVTDVSGRGVGMDVVKTNIENLGGTVEIETEVGKGTTINIKLPLTLAIIPSLIVRCGDNHFAVPQVNINELVRIKASEVAEKIERVKNAEVLRLRGSLLPLVRLSHALNLNAETPSSTTVPAARPSKGKSVNQQKTKIDDDVNVPEHSNILVEHKARPTALNIVVVETGLLRYGVVVDELFDSKEIVVKPMGRHMKSSTCLAGATILGDGKIALILDVAGIAAHLQLVIPDSRDIQREHAAGNKGRQDKQSILIFTNAPQEYFAIPNAYISRIERIKSEQIDSVGGREVLQYRGVTLPLVSLENHIKAKPRPETAAVYIVVFKNARQEIGLIAPNLVDICEINTDIDTSTFREKGVIGSVIVDGHTVRFVDVFELIGEREQAFSSPVSTATASSIDAKSVLPAISEKTSSASAGVTQSTPAQQEKKTILLAEDSDFFRQQIIKFLEGEGYQVIGCEDGVVAWEVLDSGRHQVDLVVTDIEMPRLDGLGLSKKIKASADYAHLPIIAVTSLASDEDVEKGRQAGIDEYKIKLDRDELLEAVARYLAEATVKS